MEEKVKQRIALSIYFFLAGICFSSWAARIPTIKLEFGLNEAELGSILLTMPISSISGLPISGWLVAKFDSRWPLIGAFMIHSLFLYMIGISESVTFLVIAIFIFAFSMRIQNIAINTQSITLQKKFKKKIVGSFHALWSLGGIAGVGFSTLMLAYDISIETHLMIVCIFTLLVSFATFNHLQKGDRSTSGNKIVLGKPDPHIMSLGCLTLFAAVCEGGMFDWSGLYFKEVVKVEIFTAGYLIFMVCMALSRFASDWFIQKLGMPKMYTISASLIFIGIGLAIIFPTFWISMLGFSMVGMGTASIIPMTFVLAGTSKKYSPGLAISIIATYAMVGILAGPPIIGYIAHSLNLRYSFVLLALSGMAIIPISRWFFRVQDK